MNKNICHSFFMLLAVLIAPATLHAVDQDCYGGSWQLVETVQDEWAYKNQYTQQQFVSSGTTMDFWIQPTSCADVACDGGFKIEFGKRLVCVLPTYTKTINAPGGVSCNVDTGNAIPDPYWPSSWNLTPCFVLGHTFGWWGGGSAYGDVTIANNMNKFKWVCPSTIISKRNNEGEPMRGPMMVECNSNILGRKTLSPSDFSR